MRDITAHTERSGVVAAWSSGDAAFPNTFGGAFFFNGWGNATANWGGGLIAYGLSFQASRVVPTSLENKPIALSLPILISY